MRKHRFPFTPFPRLRGTAVAAAAAILFAAAGCGRDAPPTAPATAPAQTLEQKIKAVEADPTIPADGKPGIIASLRAEAEAQKLQQQQAPKPGP